MKDKKKILRDVNFVAKEIAAAHLCDDGNINTRGAWAAINRIKAYVTGRNEGISVKEFLTYIGKPL